MRKPCTVTAFLAIWMLAATVGRASDCGSEEEATSPGIYLVRGVQAELICELDGVETTDRPVLSEERELRSLPHTELKFDVLISEQMRELGMGPSSLRLLRVEPGEYRPKMRVVAMAPELFPGEVMAFALTTAKPLPPGRYHFALERPGWTKGMAVNETVMEFFGCAFMADAPPDPEQRD